jgi:multisubunit Na+/H+ antiporter MnhC subunit
MICIRKYALHVLLAATLIVLLVSSVKATSMSFTVPAGQVETQTVNLDVEDHVTITFTVTGQDTNGLDFYILDPQGNVQRMFNSTSNVNYQFVCSKAGAYELCFSNTGSAGDKYVSLDYEVQHYILGMPQMLFLTLVVVGICLVMVAVFVLMGKPRYIVDSHID